MIAICECPCGAIWTCRAEDDPDTNAIELTGNQNWCPQCGSMDFEVTGVEDDDD